MTSSAHTLLLIEIKQYAGYELGTYLTLGKILSRYMKL